MGNGTRGSRAHQTAVAPMWQLPGWRLSFREPTWARGMSRQGGLTTTTMTSTGNEAAGTMMTARRSEAGTKIAVGEDTATRRPVGEAIATDMAVIITTTTMDVATGERGRQYTVATSVCAWGRASGVRGRQTCVVIIRMTYAARRSILL